MAKKKFYVTTPIYYPNDKLHIGHAYTTVLADYIARYKKMNGYEVMFLTGSDEHGQKIHDKALENNQDPFEFVTKIIEGFKGLWKDLGIDYDLFIRTTDELHKKYVRKTFTEFLNKDEIHKSKYYGMYCKSDEAFFTKSQLIDGKCPECKREVIEISEESYFLKISNYGEWIKKELLNNKELLKPKSRVNELIKNFVEDLQDLSITRTSFSWGIKPNEDEKHVIYVWLDALLNYISALNYPESKFTEEEVWSKKSNVELLQLVGKEITRFHCIYWPIMLKLKNYRMPRILAHGWLVTDVGEKMSKSKKNVVDPIQLIKTYGKDPLRFYLINNIVTGSDGKYSVDLLEETINSILVNKYSNLVARTNSMLIKYFDGVVPKNKKNVKIESSFNKKLNKIFKQYTKEMDEFSFSNSTKEIIKYIEEVNGFIDDTEPWKANEEELSSILNILVREIFNINLLLSPILIDSTKKVFKWLNYENEISFKDLNKDFSGTKINELDFLFNRIEKNNK